MAGQPAREIFAQLFFRELIHTHTFPPPTHIPTLGAFTVAESHTILTWGMIHQLFRRVYADSPLCDSCVFFPLHGYQLVLVKFSSVLRIRLGFNADPGSSFGQDPFPVRIQFQSGSVSGDLMTENLKFYWLKKIQIFCLKLLLFKMFIALLQYYLMTQSQWVH